MAYAEFIEMLAKRSKTTPEKLLAQRPLSFPVSTNARGETLIDFIRATLRIDLKGMRCLDVGCAYGGFSLALAKAGAVVTGIDIAPGLLKYAEANARGVADVPFLLADASSVDMRRLFKPGSFDLIVLNDVLEHIYDTASLFENLDYLLSPKGVVYFKVPNGQSPRWALSEGHRKIFALSLMDPDCWQYLYPKRASIFYRPLSHFQGLFQWFGLPHMAFVDLDRALPRMSRERLQGELDEVTAQAEIYPYPHADAEKYVKGVVGRFQDRFAFDCETRDDAFVRFVYGTYFYVGFASRKSLKLAGKPVRIASVGDVLPRPESYGTAKD